MSLDPAFYELRTKPLPTMSERRRLVRERLAKERAALVELRTLGAEPRAILAKCDDVKLLRKALAYLGEPDPRLDLYRLFGMPLPPPREPPVQLQLALPRPRSS